MPTIKRTWQLVVTVALVGVMLSGANAQSQTAPAADEQLPALIRSIKGPDLFRVYCASCHGSDAKGAGPVAPSLKTKVPDLTLLASKNREQFPAARVRQTVLGEDAVAAHGSREMPIWGPIFHQVEGDVDWGNVRLENLVKYLESIQSMRGSNAPSGAEVIGNLQAERAESVAELTQNPTFQALSERPVIRLNARVWIDLNRSMSELPCSRQSRDSRQSASDRSQ